MGTDEGRYQHIRVGNVKIILCLPCLLYILRKASFGLNHTCEGCIRYYEPVCICRTGLKARWKRAFEIERGSM